MHARIKQVKSRAFTKVDLLAGLPFVGLLFGLALSHLTAAERLTAREVCRNNLAEVGKAFRAWAMDHDGKQPWVAPREAGGSHGLSSAGNAWVQMAWLSNQLTSPKVLACPSDKVRAATEWSRQQSGGFWHPEFRDNALSYFVGLDVTEHSPKAFLSGDRTLQVTARAQRCDYAGVRTAASLEPTEELRWLEEGHGNPANILFNDGSVGTLSNEQIREAASKTDAYHEDNHALWPRALGSD